jgi:hypothetical protein
MFSVATKLYKTGHNAFRAVPPPVLPLRRGPLIPQRLTLKSPLRAAVQWEGALVPQIKGSTVAPSCTVLPYLIVEKNSNKR